jgi:predicted dehydrogenase
MSQTVNVGVIGCGAISAAYLGMAKNFPLVHITACADINLDVAKAKAQQFNVSKACSVDELLADDSIELVLNLTVPKAHVPIGLQSLRAGKHVYGEKPLGIVRKEGQKLVAEAKKRRLRIGCAPDTFMGTGIQTARKLIDDGAIGRPVAFTAFMLGRGPEGWHPNPEFFYKPGGGPMLDMGPYYLTALMNLLGPIQRLNGLASIAIPVRTIGSQPHFGKSIKVETPDLIVGDMEFKNSATGVIIESFATMFSTQDGTQPITIYGEEGTLKVPDPNGFDGPVHLRKAGDAEWKEVPHMFVKGYGRSVGVADMAYAIRSGRPHRANGDQAMAVLDAMQGFLDSSKSNKAYKPVTKYKRTAPMPAHLPFGTLDE